jgi:hypothetical protein
MLPFIKKILVILLVMESLFFIGQHWRDTLKLSRENRGTDALDRWEAHLTLAREALPIKRGVIGYIAVVDTTNLLFNTDWDTETEYMLTQYAVAPLILQKGPVAEWNIAVLTSKDVAEWQAKYPGQYEVMPVKGNVYIFHKLNNP